MSVGLLGFGTVAWVSTHPTVLVRSDGMAYQPRMQVLAVAHSITAGNLLKPEDLTNKEINSAEAPVGVLMDTPDDRGALVGSMVRRTIDAGGAVMPGDIMRPGDHGFLAAVLGPGMRAMTVSVDAVSGTAGLIWPGDRVDLILLQSRDDATLPAGQRVGAETVLSNVRVIAIDQHMVRGVAPDAPSVNRSDQQRTATLEVSPDQAERVSVAAHIGKLSLTVRAAEPAPGERSAGDAPKTNGGAAVTWASDVSPSLNPGKKAAETTIVHVYQGDDKDGKGEEFKF